MTSAEASSAKRISNYDDVVDKAFLNDVQLMALNFDIKPLFFSSVSGRKLSYVVERSANHYDSEAGLAASFITMSVVGKVGRKTVLTCRANYNVVYDSIDGCDSEAVDAFLRRVAPFVCYPYFRSLFASLDWAAGLRLPPLPVHKEQKRNLQVNSGKPKAKKALRSQD